MVLQVLLSVRMAPSARFHLGYVFLIGYFQLVGAVGAMSLIVVDRLCEWGIQKLRNQRVETTLAMFFDVGLHILSTLAGAVMVAAILRIPALQSSRGLPPVQSIVLFSLGFFLVHSSLTSIAVYSRFGFSDLRTRLWPATVLWTGVSLAASIPLAIITWSLIGPFGDAWAALIMLVLSAAVALILKLNVGLRDVNREQRALNTIGNLLNSTLSTRELYTILASETRKVLPWDRFFVALGSHNSSVNLIYVDASGSQTSPRTVPRGVGLTGRAMTSGEVVHYEEERDRETEIERFESTGKRRPRSMVVAPMRFGDRVFGAIGVQSFRQESYGKRHHRLLETIAAQAATALRNAQLYESERLANEERDEFVSLVTHEKRSKSGEGGAGR
ncbi:MAG: GAF domain-containing protein, partial [Thermoanaerobaculia bacterium]|nr:GAF domain-containing protein [Thermoanaerobaculia bacterium]